MSLSLSSSSNLNITGEIGGCDMLTVGCDILTGGGCDILKSSSSLKIGGEGCRCDILTRGGCDILTRGGDSLSLSLSEMNPFFFATSVLEVPGCGDTAGGGVTGRGVSGGDSLTLFLDGDGVAGIKSESSSLSSTLSEKNPFFFATCVPEVPGCGDPDGGVP